MPYVYIWTLRYDPDLPWCPHVLPLMFVTRCPHVVDTHDFYRYDSIWAVRSPPRVVTVELPTLLIRRSIRLITVAIADLNTLNVTILITRCG